MSRIRMHLYIGLLFSMSTGRTHAALGIADAASFLETYPDGEAISTHFLDYITVGRTDDGAPNLHPGIDILPAGHSARNPAPIGWIADVLPGFPDVKNAICVNFSDAFNFPPTLECGMQYFHTNFAPGVVPGVTLTTEQTIGTAGVGSDQHLHLELWDNCAPAWIIMSPLIIGPSNTEYKSDIKDPVVPSRPKVFHDGVDLKVRVNVIDYASDEYNHSRRIQTITVRDESYFPDYPNDPRASDSITFPTSFFADNSVGALDAGDYFAINPSQQYCGSTLPASLGDATTFDGYYDLRILDPHSQSMTRRAIAFKCPT